VQVNSAGQQRAAQWAHRQHHVRRQRGEARLHTSSRGVAGGHAGGRRAHQQHHARRQHDQARLHTVSRGAAGGHAVPGGRTDSTTPAVSTTRLSSSNEVGTFFSISTPSSAVSTGMPERMICDSDSDRNTSDMLFSAMLATCAPPAPAPRPQDWLACLSCACQTRAW